MKKIAIVTDSSAGISKQQAALDGIHVARMPISVDGKEFIDEENITRLELLQYMRKGSVVSTAQPVLGYTIELFEALLKEYDEIVYLPISRKLSGTYATGRLLEEQFDHKLVVVDTLSVAYPLYHLALEAKKLAYDGLSAQMIKEVIEKDYSFFAILVPEDIVYLKRGGRITPAAAALANLLKINPILKVTDGEIDKLDKVRTFKKAIHKGLDHLKDVENKENYDWFVLDGESDPELLADTIKRLREIVPNQNILTDYLCPIVVTHTGPGSIAFGYTKKLSK